MMTPSIKDLHDAIMTNSSQVVESYLSQGANPNCNHAALLPAWNEAVDGYGNANPNITVAVAGNAQDSISSLHLAVINCFHKHTVMYTRLNHDSLWTLEALLESGANASYTTRGVYVGLDGTTGKYTLVPAENGMTPLQLALFLKKHVLTPPPGLALQETMMNHVTSLLLESTKPPSTNEPLKIQASSVPTSVLTSWKTMLLDSEFYDVTFECNNGKSFRAHKCILSAASDYFRNYFTGPWSRHHPNGVWKTSNSSDVMWAVLTFIYTGELSAATVKAHAKDLLCVAHEYHLRQLFEICQDSCIRNLSLDNIKTMLQLAHLHDSKELQNACFDFVRAHAAQTLVQPDFIQLSTEDPTLWNKLTKAVSPDGNKGK